MRDAQIEAWVLSQIDGVASGSPVEDNRVELKAEWPTDHAKAAKQIAGLANASRGDAILWIVGLDEKRGVVGANEAELSNWWPKVQKSFDGGITPALHALNVPTDGPGPVVALYFSTDRVPFVTKNSSGSGPDREVPWREGNSTRTAKRSDLIRLLVPKQALPEVELIEGTVDIIVPEDQPLHPDQSPPLPKLAANLRLYLTHLSGVATVIPFHRCSASVTVGGVEIEPVGFRLSLSPPKRRKPGPIIHPFDPDGFEKRLTDDSGNKPGTNHSLVRSGKHERQLRL